ncbi:MAG: hypothetical protein ACRDTS_22030, partial [Mycobacterium sp.]
MTSRIVADGAIIRRDLADNAVNGSKLADNAVGMSQLTGDVRSNLNNPSLSSVSNTYPLDKTVNDVGGPIAGNDGSGQGVTDIMHIRLKAGTYLLTYHG